MDTAIPRSFESERRTGRHRRYSAAWDCRHCREGRANYPHRYMCRKCGMARPVDTRPEEAAQFRDTTDEQDARVRKRRPDNIREQFGVGRGCQITRTVRDARACAKQVGLNPDERFWIPSRRFFRHEERVLEYPGSRTPPSHDHVAFRERELRGCVSKLSGGVIGTIAGMGSIGERRSRTSES